MNGQRWIDDLFRKRMERRTFPVEKGEFEEMRALLDMRNSGEGLIRGGGGFSKWWLSALLPMTGLLWWTFGERSDALDEHLSSTTEDAAIIDQSVAARQDFVASNANVEVEVDLPHTVVGTELNDRDGIPAGVDLQNTAVNDPFARTPRDVRSTQGAVTSAPGPDGVMDALDMTAGSTNAQAVGPDGAALNGQPFVGPDQVNGQVLVDDGNAAQHGVLGSTLPDQAGLNNSGDDQGHANSAETLELPSARIGTEAVELMQPRWIIPAVLEPEPMRHEVELFKRIPTGELHFFGAPLLVRTRSSTGDRSGAEPGSLVGLEYRVRSKRVSWATGIRYGSYALKADQGATDVRLDFVELPLLASIQRGWGRFGLSMQGGLSIDLLFNARGRYPDGNDGTVTVFPQDAFRTVNYSWSLRPQAVYQVNERLSVNAGPLWKAQIGEVAKRGSLDGATISSTGLAIGITLRLDRSTF